MSKKLLAFILVISVIFCGCNASSVTSVSTLAPDYDRYDDVSLDVCAFMYSDNSLKFWQDTFAAAFKEAYPHISLNIDVLPWKEQIDAVYTRNQGVPYDIYAIEGGNVNSMIAADRYVLAYNSDILDESGVAVPGNISEFLEACNRVKAEGITPCAMNLGTSEAYMTYSFFSTILGEDINMPSVPVFSFIKGLYDAGFIIGDPFYDDYETIVNRLIGKECAFAILPESLAKKSSYTFLSNNEFYVYDSFVLNSNETDENKLNAMDAFLKFFYSKDVYDEFLNAESFSDIMLVNEDDVSYPYDNEKVEELEIFVSQTVKNAIRGQDITKSVQDFQ